MEFFARKRTQNRTGMKRETDFSRQIFRGIIRLVLTALVLVLVWYGTRLTGLTISEISVVGGETISHEMVKAEVEDELIGSYFLLVPRRFAYVYPHDRIVERLTKIGGLHDLQVTRTSRTSLNVSFKEYVPYALWCSDKEGSPCWFLSNDGYAFTLAPFLQGGTLMRHLIEGSEEIARGRVVSEEKLRTIDTFVSRASEELGLRITALTHKRNGDIEFSVNGGGMILVSSTRDLNTTYENLKSVFTSPEFKHLTPGNFQYVDVRFENKVFVNEEPVVVGTTTDEKLPE